jgi:hypothetical protein
MRLLLLFLLILSIIPFYSQQETNREDDLTVHGNFQFDGQYYEPDSLIGAPKVDEKILSNAFGNLVVSKGKFSAGLRYEAYNNVMIGFDQNYKGQGIVNRFFRYSDKFLDVTVGHSYEQFGTGLIFRTWYEPGLLYDNALDGVRVISNPYQGITIKGLMGRQRSYFTLGPGIVRGADLEINLNDLFGKNITDSLGNSEFKRGLGKTNFTLGGSAVSKFQKDEDPNYVLPENVAAFAGRFQISNDWLNVLGEYVYKINDPSADNSSFANNKTLYSYKFGDAMFLSASVAKEGMSFLLQLKRVDNMSFRSDRFANLQNLLINYVPATTRQHTYLMPAFNPYATQLVGEVGGMAEFQYKIPKGTIIGGPYGTEITLNFSQANGLKKIPVNDTNSTSTLYRTNYFEAGSLYYYDGFMEITRKFNKKIKMNFMAGQQYYNRNILQFQSENAGYPAIVANFVVLDITYKYSKSGSIRWEAQGYFTRNPKNPNAGNWATMWVEWNPNGKFFLAILDQYNYGNPESKLQLHYPLLSLGFMQGPHRITINAGKQRQGIFCVGGVCRFVPASNGVAITISSSF